MENSGLPKNKQYSFNLIPSKIDLNSFKQLKNIKDGIADFVTGSQNLYIYSDYFGNGKTSWAIKLLQKYFDEIWAGNGFRCRGIFISVPLFLTRNKEIISHKDIDYELLRERLLTTDLVVWDDIAASKLSDFDYNNLLTYIDSRKMSGLSNIFTGNVTTEQKMIEYVGTRLSSRIWNDSIRVEFKGEDRRGTHGFCTGTK
jgi:DNA replication protein DnaC